MAIRSTLQPPRAGIRSWIRTGIAVVVIAITVGVLASQATSIWTNRAHTPSEEVAPAHRIPLPVFMHPGVNRGQVRYGRFDDVTEPTRPHGPNQRPKWGASPVDPR